MIRESVNMLEEAAKRINVVCVGQERTVQDNKTTTAEVAASVHQISATARELATTMQSVREISASTESGADTGRASLDRLSETMQRC
jgi:methyl-accepting chemotaxis protein